MRMCVCMLEAGGVGTVSFLVTCGEYVCLLVSGGEVIVSLLVTDGEESMCIYVCTGIQQ